jgi:preprotein translocase subunit YajC
MFIANAFAQGGNPSAAGNGLSLFFLFFILVVFYWFVMRPQQKRQKELQKMVEALKKGDEVVTTAGILGRIAGLDENYVALTVANGTEIKFLKSHINAVLPKGTLKAAGAE